MGRAQLWAKTQGYEFRYYYNILPAFKNRVCLCDVETYDFNDRSHPTWFCHTCKKPPLHFLNQCFVCGETFIKDFSWPYYCLLDPTCWNCSQDIAAPCLQHSVINMYKEKGYPLTPPMGLNPKFYTAQELDGSVFDWD